MTKQQCVASARNTGRWPGSHQCNRTASEAIGEHHLCKQHYKSARLEGTYSVYHKPVERFGQGYGERHLCEKDQGLIDEYNSKVNPDFHQSMNIRREIMERLLQEVADTNGGVEAVSAVQLYMKRNGENYSGVGTELLTKIRQDAYNEVMKYSLRN